MTHKCQIKTVTIKPIKGQMTQNYIKYSQGADFLAATFFAATFLVALELAVAKSELELSAGLFRPELDPELELKPDPEATGADNIRCK